MAFDRLFAFLPFCWFLFGAFIFQEHFDLLDPLYSSPSLPLSFSSLILVSLVIDRTQLPRTSKVETPKSQGPGNHWVLLCQPRDTGPQTARSPGSSWAVALCVSRSSAVGPHEEAGRLADYRGGGGDAHVGPIFSMEETGNWEHEATSQRSELLSP